MYFNNVHIQDTAENKFDKLIQRLNDFLAGKSPSIVFNHGTTGEK